MGVGGSGEVWVGVEGVEIGIMLGSGWVWGVWKVVGGLEQRCGNKRTKRKNNKTQICRKSFSLYRIFRSWCFLALPSLFYLQFIQAESSTCMWNLSSTCVECISTDECGWVENGWAGVGVGGRNVRMGGGVIAENTCGRGVSKVGVGGRGWAWV